MKKLYLQLYRHTLSVGDGDPWVHVSNLEVHPDIAEALAELGIVEIRRGYIPASHVGRMQKVLRLRRNLGVNLAGATIILDLLERIEVLQEEIERLKRR